MIAYTDITDERKLNIRHTCHDLAMFILFHDNLLKFIVKYYVYMLITYCVLCAIELFCRITH